MSADVPREHPTSLEPSSKLGLLVPQAAAAPLEQTGSYRSEPGNGASFTSFVESRANASCCRRRKRTGAKPSFRRRLVVYLIAMLLIFTMGGGLVFGSAPFQQAIQTEYGFTDEEATRIFNTGFNIIVFGTAIVSPWLDFVGTRGMAFAGLLLELVGNHLLSRVGFYTMLNRDTLITIGFGFIGMGGNMVMLGSMQFADLFPPGLAGATAVGLYDAAGFVFMLLGVVNFEVFYFWYQFYVILGMVAVLIVYPDSAYESPESEVRFCKLSCRLKVPNFDELKATLMQLSKPNTWCFLLTFAWTATCVTWALGSFSSICGKKDVLTSDNQHSSSYETLTRFQPLVTQATFFLSPVVGIVLSRCGFVPIILALGVVVTCTCAMLWLLPLQFQWFALAGVNASGTLVYQLQWPYVFQSYEGGQVGFMLALSVLAQSMANLLLLVIPSDPLYIAPVTLMLPVLPLCLLWACVEKIKKRQIREIDDEAS